MKKCGFRNFEVKYLKDVVGSGKLLVDYEKEQSMKDWPAPIKIKEF